MPLEFEEVSRYHAEGLQRVARVIAGNPVYDQLMVHRLSSAEANPLVAANDIATKRSIAIDRLRKSITVARHTVFFPECHGFCCDGNTKNNIREFEFFDELCKPLGISVVGQNLASLPRVSLGKLSPLQSRIAGLILRDLENYYENTDNVTASLIQQHAAYSKYFFSSIFSFFSSGAVLPTALVTANDHSPARVATSMVMKAAGVPRIYLQHAEVTRLFPPLDFEFNVLRNLKSFHTYGALGAVDQNTTFVISRQSDAFRADELARERRGPVVVVIYPTARVKLEALRQLVAALSKNTLVSRIILKEHPGSAGAGLSSLASFEKLEFSKSIPLFDHLAIVGNSSVAVELLHRGIPVYHDFSLDPVGRDYYGLVRSGITREIVTSEAEGAFWTPYAIDDDWLEAYRLWDPMAGSDPQADRDRFLAAMGQLKAVPTGKISSFGPPLRGRWKAELKEKLGNQLIQVVNQHPRLPSMVLSSLLRFTHRLADRMSVWTDRIGRYVLANAEIRIDGDIWRRNLAPATHRPEGKAGTGEGESEFIISTLATIQDPASWLVENERVRVIPPPKVFAALASAANKDNPIFDHILRLVPDSIAVDTSVALWLRLKKAEVHALPVKQDEIAQYVEFLSAFEGEEPVRRELELVLLRVLLQSGEVTDLSRFWRQCRTLGMETLTAAERRSLSQKLSSRGSEGMSPVSLTRLPATPSEQS
jgi:hypothetical protein